MTLTSGLSIAVGGLANIDRQLALLAHNVSNANTPGYVREIAVQTALTADGIGIGVHTGPAIRFMDAALQRDLQHQASAVADLTTRQAALSAIDATQGAPGSGTDLASLLGAVRDTFSGLANNPADQAGQRATVTAAQTLATGINTLANSYAAQRQLAQDNAQAGVSALNQNLALVGDLSNRIIRLHSMGESTADLESQRDAVINHLSELLDVKILAQPNGDVLLVTAQGLSLPTRGTADPFSLADANLAAGAWYPGGGITGIMLGGVDVSAQFGTGRIGANLALRDEILPTYQAALDEFSQTLSQRFAAQGLDMFTDATGSVPPGGGVPVQSSYIGYAATIQVNPAIIANAALVRDGTQAIAGSPTGASAFIPNPSTGPAGFTTLIQRVLDFTFGTEAQAGVTQISTATTGLGPGGSLALAFNPPGTLADFAAQMLAMQATQSADIATQREAEAALQTTLQAKFDTVTGVNVDTEMALMVQLQNSYGANARVIAAMQAMWDQLLGAVR